MGLTSLQVCMDSDWLQGTIHEENGMDSSSPYSGGDMLTCSRPLIERRQRPPHDTALKCPRCDSTHTKFCYYNNYSLSQPRYFCKTCRRYWTKGGTLRNIPVGGGCRKNKKVSTTTSKKSNDNNINNNQPCNIVTQNVPGSLSINNPTDLQLSFPEMQFLQFSNLYGAHGGLANPDFMETKYNAMFENPRAIEFMESAKYEGPFLRNGIGDQLGKMGGLGHDLMGGTHGLAPNFHGNFCTPFGMSLDGQNNTFMDTTCQRALLPYEGNHKDQNNAIEVKPNTKLLSFEWQDQGCSDIAGKDSFGYISGLGSWTGLMNGYGPSTTNSLV